MPPSDGRGMKCSRLEHFFISHSMSMLYHNDHSQRTSERATPTLTRGRCPMAAERPVLIVDDDAALRAILIEQLVDDGEFEGVSAASIKEVEAKFAAPNARFDAVLLDGRLPDGHGRDLCIRLRQQGHRMPIIMMTGDDSEADIVRSLDAGANDYVVKPFRLAILLARLRAQVRTFETTEHAVFTIGPYT